MEGDDGIGNDLLVRGIGLRLGPRQKKVVAARKKDGEVFFWLKVEALETSELVEEATLNDQDIFFAWIHCWTASFLTRDIG